MVQLCDELLSRGVCSRSDCPYSHDVFNCQVCRVVYETGPEYEKHLSSVFHHRRVIKDEKRQAGTSQPVLCTVCSVDLSSVTLYEQHSRGRRHLRALRDNGLIEDPGPEELDVPRNCTRCDICSTNILTKFWDSHVNGLRHKNATKFTSLKGALDESEQDKNGIVLTEDRLDFGVLDYNADTAATKSRIIDFQNTNSTSIILVHAYVSSQRTSRASLSHFRLREEVRTTRVKPSQKGAVVVTFDSRGERGRFEDRAELVFEDPSLKRRFSITRPLVAIVGVKEDYEALKARAPYVRPKRKLQEPIAEVTRGIPPPSIAAITWTVRLLEYKAPEALVRLAFNEGEATPSQIATRVRTALLPDKLDKETYGRHFSMLLWIEEERARRDLQQYNLEEETLVPCRPFYELEVDGLAEKRPSVIVSDRIFIRHYNSSSKHWWEGHVHKVKERSVLLRFHGTFNSFKGQKYHVRFDLNRLVYRRMHQGLNTAVTFRRILFPRAEHITALRPPRQALVNDLRTIDRKIMDNPPQLEAVAAILYRLPGSVPFIVYGPPGTGKTVTIVEAMRQIILADPNAYILACAPSNSASDLIAERLSGLGKAQLFRLNAPSRRVDSVPKGVINFSRTSKDAEGLELFSVPPPEELKKFRAVVCTCFSASVPYGIGVPKGHFTHIFIDEAGQATEPEVMIPIKTLADVKTNVILSGDSKQLGPIVRSPVARELGLSTSYLDRLMANPIYEEKEGRGVTIEKLTKNWRSHKAILKFPNDEFYRSELEACGDPTITHSILRWDGLARKDFPIIFHGISGKDEREASSPSFFNIAEASLVKEYVKDLLDDRRLRLKPENIGIISPYHAQVCKIRRVLPHNAKDIKVGSVEEYQGQEKRVIIISTVRTSMDFVKFDLRHTLGFVANPRRFNVAITRAQALLVVIGDPIVLSLDPLWKSFINYVHNAGGCKGKRIDWDPTEEVDRTGRHDSARIRRGLAMSELEELIERTKGEILGQTENLRDHDEEDVLEGNADRPWREDE
ncbi:hypothetical protein M0805_008071 [Coniferiporia weirii]|nr:hypothetical protein M0805_008071 [Coniferiporia weirii]